MQPIILLYRLQISGMDRRGFIGLDGIIVVAVVFLLWFYLLGSHLS